MSGNFLRSPGAAPPAIRRSEVNRTHMEPLAADADARAAKRREDLEELRSDLSSPEQRIRAWERVHELTLPLNPNHPILDVIAVKTRLTMEQVQDVQRAEAARRAVRPPLSKP
jgi:7-keto-8-aminopelargonate synthetase-like enzyme